VAALDEQGRKQGATLFMMLLTAYQGLLARASGKERFLVAFPVANRTHAETESMLGRFVNLVYVPATVPGRATFNEVLRETKKQLFLAHAQQTAPVAEVEASAGLPADGRALFNLLPPPGKPAELPGLSFATSSPLPPEAEFDWSLVAEQVPAGIELRLHFRADRYERSGLSRALEQYRLLVSVLAQGEDRPMGDILESLSGRPT
jgi:non-ribosomal peptide synthetase component F